MGFGEIETLRRRDGVDLAYERQPGRGPLLVWLSGFGSDMAGTKAHYLAEWARARGRGFLRLDYSGHGRSGGRFEDGSISCWRDDALSVIDAASDGPLTLVGSSMGGWIALLIALARPTRVHSLALIAPAPDFTEKLVWPLLSLEAREAILTQGFWAQPSAYDERPQILTRTMVEDGRQHNVLDAPIDFAGPVRILQGQADPDVPWRHSLLLAEKLTRADVEIRLVKDGDHRLSRPQDLARLAAMLETLPALP